MSTRWFFGIAALLFGVLIYFATDKLTESPPTWFDEGVLVQTAMNESVYGIESIQIAPDVRVPPAYVTTGFSALTPISWSFSLFGIDLLHARAVMVLYILGAAAVFFYLSYALFGKIPALCSLILLATFPPLYGQGKNVLGEVPGLMYLGAFLIMCNELEKNDYRGVWRYVLLGLFAGLTVVTKPIFILLPVATLVALLVHHKKIRCDVPLITIGFVSFLVPMTWWYVSRFSLSDSLSQLVAYYANPYTIHNVQAQVIENILRFFREAPPGYFGILMGVWLCALALRAWKRQKISVSETTLFAFAFIVALAYLRTPGWYRYFFLAEIPALVFAPPALLYLASLANFRHRFAAQIGAYLVLSVFLALQLYQLFVGSWVAQHAARTTTHDLAKYFSTLPKEATYFVYNTPAAVVFLPSRKYYQYLELNTAVLLGANQVQVLEQGLPDYVITNDRAWNLASTTLMSKYKVIKTIDSIVVAYK